MLGLALLGTACGADDVLISAGTTTVPEPSTSTAPSTTEPAPTTTTAPEPVATTQAPVVEPPATTVPRPVRTTVTTAYVAPEAPSGRCGGSLPPCWVMNAESGGSLTAVNARGCGGRGCYGKWQFDPRTSQGLGYPLTMDQYPESVQDEAARTLWNGGRGCSHWNAC